MLQEILILYLDNIKNELVKENFQLAIFPTNESVLRSRKRQKGRRETTSDRISQGKTGQADFKNYFENYTDISIGNM